MASRVRPRRFDIDCTLTYEVDAVADFVFQIHALQGVDQEVLSESLALTTGVPGEPGVRSHVYVDPYVGQRFLRVHVDAGARGATAPCKLRLRYRAEVAVRRPAPDPAAAESAFAELPDDIVHLLLPTRYCPSDLLGSAATKLFGDLAPGHARVEAIADWIHRNVDYRLGASDSTTTACDTFLRRAGVCRDFAHLGVTFCRALGIPARLAVGYALFEAPPPDFHAVFEAWLGGRWVLFDPTRLSDPRGLVRIAMGRDAKDVAFATLYGAARPGKVRPCIERVS